MSEYIINEVPLGEAVFLYDGRVASTKYEIREEVVRCRDCRHFKPGEEEPPVDWCDYFHDEVTPLGFCAWGERSEE